MLLYGFQLMSGIECTCNTSVSDTAEHIFMSNEHKQEQTIETADLSSFTFPLNVLFHSLCKSFISEETVTLPTNLHFVSSINNDWKKLIVNCQ